MVYEIGRTKSGLRMGFTTGSCAAAAAKAATYMLLSGETIQQVKLMTPKGIELYLDVEKIRQTEKFVECAIRKYSGFCFFGYSGKFCPFTKVALRQMFSTHLK